MPGLKQRLRSLPTAGERMGQTPQHLAPFWVWDLRSYPCFVSTVRLEYAADNSRISTVTRSAPQCRVSRCHVLPNLLTDNKPEHNTCEWRWCSRLTVAVRTLPVHRSILHLPVRLWHRDGRRDYLLRAFQLSCSGPQLHEGSRHNLQTLADVAGYDFSSRRRRCSLCAVIPGRRSRH